MSWSVATTVAPEGAAVDIDDALEHVNASEEEGHIVATWIAAATALIENWTSRRLLAQTVVETVDWFPFGVLPLHVYPIASVDAVRYYDSDNALQTLSASDYYAHISRKPPILEPVNSWPTTGNRFAGVQIEMTVGGAVSGVPDDIKHAIRLLCAHFDQNREAVVAGMSYAEAPLGVKALLASHRLYAQ